MNIQRVTSNRMLRVAFLIAIVFVAAAAIHILRKHREEKQDQLDDRAIIARNLRIDDKAVQSERIVIDDYRGYHGVYFKIKVNSIAPLDLLKNSGYKNYNDDSQERHDLVLHSRNYKYLKNLEWGPIERYSQSPQYVGVWEKEYLVYITVSGEHMYGYFENKYNVPGGPGPFQ